MKKLSKNTERMFQCFFGAVYHTYEKTVEIELADYLLNQFNFTFRFPSGKKHKVTFGQHEVTIENEYFKMHYKNLDPKREFYMTPQTELLVVEVEIFKELPQLQFRD